MKHTYSEEEKEKIAQLVFDWMYDLKYRVIIEYIKIIIVTLVLLICLLIYKY